MNLRTIIISAAVALFTLIFIGTLFISVNHYRLFLLNQTQMQIQNTASMLSFSLSEYAENGDLPTMETMINALFETGNYAEIVVTSPNNQILILRKRQEIQHNVPAWFTHYLPMPIYPAQGMISSGWKQFGTVTVFSNTNVAYKNLWHISLSLFWWFLSALILMLILILIALNYMLKPLAIVARQADNISNKQFAPVKKLPWTTELRSVVDVMNKLSTNVKKMFAEQAALTDKLQIEVYRDPLTLLGNRHYFNLQLEHMLREQQLGNQSVLFLLEIHGIENLKKLYGFEVAENYFLKIASLLQSYSQGIQNSLVCRLSDIAFVLLLPNVDEFGLNKLAEELMNKIQLLHHHLEDIKAYVGIAWYQENHSATAILSQADMALRRAQAAGNYHWYLYPKHDIEHYQVYTAKEWRLLLESVIAKKEIILYFQPIFYLENDINILSQYEVLLRIKDNNGKLLPAAYFIPIAENLDLMCVFDKLVIENVIYHIVKEPAAPKFAVNLSNTSLTSSDFHQWLNEILQKHPQSGSKIIFEISESLAVTHLSQLKAFIQDMKPFGVEISIDQFGKGFSSVRYLESLNIRYLKIDGGFTYHIDTDRENQFFVRTLVTIAHNLDIKVFALSIESEEEFKTMRSLGIDGYQGYFLGGPVETYLLSG